MTQEIQIILTLVADASKNKDEIEKFFHDMEQTYTRNVSSINRWEFPKITLIDIKEEAEIYNANCTKQLTKVTKTYSTKNKLQLLILTELEKADCLLFENKKQAIDFINQLYQSALRQYNGKAAAQPLKEFKTIDKEHVFYVEDVVNISIYNVKTDLS